ncbi:MULTISPECIES: CHASE2 domain-containing protein [unclassified Coleofasciculus]|uniref:CHASE2 domain-containing protein n=1 Tax=unclassified Coleofasciculus TaxID=2692782 RepID=UPI0018800C3D|nr:MULTISPECIES: adenylate/guanylate cyclase domain-containing protein [unclassified Coleofasciculus]MBE9127894.1 adenylate/guanylate cyclase domain-containing protein [Coleofasciculus sp. LEGE 07081]MBE9148059.1 adenylate/guanylate cyclase domain-containing protein [Coleofasciculus sp. LEGE 07092]
MAFKKWIERCQKYLVGNHPWLPGGIAAVLSMGMWQLGAWQSLEQSGYSALFRFRPQLDWDDHVAVIAIDEASLDAYGQFPWSRDRYVQLLQALQKNPPAAIGFDILFVDPSSADSRLAEAISDSGNVTLAIAWNEEGLLLQPLPILDEAAAQIGHIYHQPDKDGISRQATVFVESVPFLGLATLKLARERTAADWLPQASQIPEPRADGDVQNLWINWPGNTEGVATYSFVDVVEGRVDPNALANKLVLVGTTATGLDPLSTPLNQTPPTGGVYIHAALIDNLINQRQLIRLPFSGTLLLLLVIGPASSWLLFRLDPRGRIVIALLLPVAWFAIAVAAFSLVYWWLPVAAPIGTVLLAGVGVQLREQYEKQQLMSLFSKYVAPETAELIWKRKAEIFENGELEPQELTATVLFSDIRGFTTISEKLPPRELLGWLNLYLDTMSRCIMQHGGVIDKYIGDAIMAVFGVPFAQTDEKDKPRHALQAIAASIAMHEKLQQLNQRFKVENKPLIEIGVGIHTGVVVAGSLGGAQRLNYSVVGDTVNVAARLETMNKEVNVQRPYNILVSGTTLDYVSDNYLGQEVGTIQLKGKETTTRVYSIVGEHSPKQLLKLDQKSG